MERKDAVVDVQRQQKEIEDLSYERAFSNQILNGLKLNVSSRTVRLILKQDLNMNWKKIKVK